MGKAGVDVHVFDKEENVIQSPRAIAYFPVVLEDFKTAGIYEDVCQAGWKNTIGASWRKPKNGGKLAHLGGNDPTKFAIHLGQHELAAVILDHLSRLPNVSVRWNTSLERFEDLESESMVKSYFAYGPDKVPQQHVSRFLIGADGGRSTVRKLLGLPLDGFTWDDWQIIAANVVYDMDTESDWGPANFIVDPDIWSVIAKTGKGPNWRVATGERVIEGLTEGSWDEEEGLKRTRQRLAALLPGNTDKAEIVKISPYKMHQRCAPSFRQGSVVLAGDAAHLTNPIGGLGLTTGLMDASLLGHVLNRILVDGQPSSLLDVYAEKRRAVFVDFTSPTATANRQRLLGTDLETLKEREDFFAKINKPDIPFLKQMFESEMGVYSNPETI
ncbi:hypothetical protein LTR10_015977 [Elasticomyces elasticus]|nr:hypothetical protein LTR10_015977 [Elasticomyces elasticus]